MPHQCTQCGHTFPDGSKEMLSGCPDCGGNKFQFKPTADDRADAAASTPDPSTTSESTTDPTAAPAADEDGAQADARREMASPDDLPAADDDAPGTSEDQTDSAPETEGSDDSGGRSNIESLRAELDDQFESIKILEPGQYELNLMELYNREEYIIALQEDGQYVIEVPDSWLGSDE